MDAERAQAMLNEVVSQRNSAWDRCALLAADVTSQKLRADEAEAKNKALQEELTKARKKKEANN